MKKKLFRILSLCLIVTVLLQTFPVNAFAKQSHIEDTTLSGEEAYILYELPDKRTADTKHFLMSDHSIMAAKYQGSVHYYANDEWKDIDNTVDDSSSSDLELLENTFESKFSKKSNGNKLVSIKKDDYSLSWHLENPNKVTAVYSSPNNTETENASVLKNIVGSVKYPDIQQGVSLEYKISGDGIKENIVLNDSSAQAQFKFSYKTNKLTPRINEDENIELYSEEDGQVIFVIEKPFMYDANKAYSEAVEMTLEAEGNGHFSVVLTADDEWITSEDRVWPIIIDPNTQCSQKSSDIWDVEIGNRYVNTSPNYSFNYVASDLIIGSNGANNVYRGLIKFNSLPNIENSTIIKAQFWLTAYLGALDSGDSALRTRPSTPMQINAHAITSSWPQTSSTWEANSQNYNPIVEDYFIYNNTDYNFSLDITESVSGWYNTPSSNYGIMLKAADETASNQIMQFTSSDWTTDSSEYSLYRPFLSINYRNNIGLENYWSYTTQSTSDGTAYINNHSGALTYVQPIWSYNSGINGFELSLIYNSENKKKDMHMGLGWKTNFNQYLEPASDYGVDSNNFVYTDGDGTKHFFVTLADGSIVDEDGLGYTFTHHPSETLPYRITTQDETVLKFSSNYCLEEITDIHGNSIYIEYTYMPEIKHINKITTSTGGELIFVYEENTVLTQIRDHVARAIDFSYTGNLLNTITRPDGSVLGFYYTEDANTYLDQIVSSDNKQLHYYFDGLSRVFYTAEIATTGHAGQNFTFNYSYNQTKITDGKNRCTTYQFDTLGRPTCIYDLSGTSYYQSYTQGNSTNHGIFSNNKVQLQTDSAQYVENLLINGAFNNGLAESVTYFESSSATCEIVQDQNLLSKQSAKIVSPSQNTGVLIKYPLLTDSTTYTFSGYIKTENVISDTGLGAGLEIAVEDAFGNWKYYYSDLLVGTTDPSADNGFQKVQAHVTLAEGENVRRVTAGLYRASGTVWIDSLQFEEGDSPNHINLLSNCSFESDLQTAAGTTSGDTANSGSKSFKITGDANNNLSLRQNVYVDGKAGDAYRFGAWAKANAVPTKEDGSSNFKMTLVVTFADGSTQEYGKAYFNEYTSDWQYATDAVVIDKDYTAITAKLNYNKNCNTAYFDSIFLFRDTVESYVYDANGNIVSTQNYASQESNYSYTNSNLSKVLSPTGTGFEYIYDDKNNLISSRSSQGVTNYISYDSTGNVTSASTFADPASSSVQAYKTYYIQLIKTGQYLTVDNGGTTALTNVSGAEFNGSTAQQWTVLPAEKGGFYLQPQNAPDMRLDVEGAYDVQDANLIIYTCNNGDNQRFYIKSRDNFAYRIETAISSDEKIVTINRAVTNTNATVLTPQGDANTDQHWYFYEVESESNPQMEDGIYQLRARHSGSFVDVPYANSAVGTRLQQHTPNFHISQQFRIERYNNTDYYTISPVCAEGQYLQATSAVPGQPVEIGNTEINDSKLFKFQYDNTHKGWRIISKLNEGYYFDVAGLSTADGAAIAIYPYYGNPNQVFILEKVSESITSSITYQDNGNFPATVTDSRGKTTTYTYDTSLGLLTGVTDANGISTTYTYNYNNHNLNSVSSGGSTIYYSYTDGNYLDAIYNVNAQRILFSYDNFWNTQAVTIGETTLAEYAYEEYNGPLSSITYGNGHSVSYVYDPLDRIKETRYNGVTKVKYTYDKSGNLFELSDLFVNTTTRYRYDLTGRMLEAKVSNGTSLRYNYDNFNRVNSITSTIPGTNSNVTEYIYGSNQVLGQKTGMLYGVKHNGAQTIAYAYDDLCRLDTRTLATTTPFVTSYTYLEGASANTTTTLVKKLQVGNDVYEYTYDNVGNITSVTKNGTIVESYEYDNLNQLICVMKGDYMWYYEYDDCGNITGAYKNAVAQGTFSYGGQYAWGDLLTSYNGQTITYDAIGNPLSYRDGLNFTWEYGRRLASVTKGTDSIQYAYNADGLRTSKTVNGVTTEYYWLDGVLLGQKCGENTLVFLYDDAGKAYGLTYNGTTYYYVFNLQGDVIGILDQTGTQVVAYEYDVWGKLLSTTGTLADSLGYVNPLRYRGYYYDNETGFYYLQSRYYDPEVCRFISADGYVAGVGSDVRGYNLFAYCMNNPVNMSDSSGSWPEWTKEIVNRAKYAITMTFRIFTSPLKAIDAKAGLGVGIGGEVSGKVQGITVSATAKKSYTDSLQLKNGQFDIKSSNSQEIGFSVGKLSVGESIGQEHSLFNKNCTCDLMNTPIVKQAECYANKEFIEENYTIGLSASLYLGIGGEVSLGINIKDFYNELIDIYHTEYVGYY